MEYLSVFSPNVGKMQTRITPNTETFYTVVLQLYHDYIIYKILVLLKLARILKHFLKSITDFWF